MDVNREDVDEGAVMDALWPIARRRADSFARAYGLTNILSDLRAHAVYGVFCAVRSFDATRGVPLEAHASRWIDGAMKNGIRLRSYLPDRITSKLRAGKRLSDRLAQELGRTLTIAEIDARLPGYREAYVRENLGRPAYVAYERVQALETVSVPGLPRNDGAESVAIANAEQAARDSVLADALATLSDRERALIEAYYFQDIAFCDIARTWQRSPQRVSRIHLRALRKLRHAVSKSVASPEYETLRIAS
jgi:RNA polymerase sigma factor for flagellar operon FliA